MNGLEKYLNMLLEKHTEFFAKASNITKNIMILGEDPDTNLDQIILDIENRERLINIVEKLQSEIENIIQENGQLIAGTELHNRINTWSENFNNAISDMNDMDHQIAEFLELLKKNTREELSRIFKTRQIFKGYNLNNLK